MALVTCTGAFYVTFLISQFIFCEHLLLVVRDVEILSLFQLTLDICALVDLVDYKDLSVEAAKYERKKHRKRLRGSVCEVNYVHSML